MELSQKYALFNLELYNNHLTIEKYLNHLYVIF